MSRSQRIAQQLGMSHGAAAHRLRKLILFNQLKKYEDNVCVRCKKIIESVDDLSIEHIDPWENRSVELFWDLNNIAFSHNSCNRPHTRGQKNKPSPKRISVPEGKSWCRTHKQFLPTENFCKHTQAWNGLKRDCRECEKKYKDRVRYGKVSEDSADGPQTVSTIFRQFGEDNDKRREAQETGFSDGSPVEAILCESESYSREVHIHRP